MIEQSAAMKYGVRPYQTGSAYDLIREAIFSGHYPPGTQLNERILGEEFNLSRTPVRQALTRLAAGGLVEQIPHVGAFVRKLTDEELVTLLDFRRAFESGIAALTAVRATAEEVEELATLGRETDEWSFKAVTEHDEHSVKRNQETEIQFHMRVVELARNVEVARVVDHATIVHLSIQISRRSSKAMSHEEVARAISTHDPRAAFAAMWDHFCISDQTLESKTVAG